MNHYRNDRRHLNQEANREKDVAVRRSSGCYVRLHSLADLRVDTARAKIRSYTVEAIPQPTQIRMEKRDQRSKVISPRSNACSLSATLQKDGNEDDKYSSH